MNFDRRSLMTYAGTTTLGIAIASLFGTRLPSAVAAGKPFEVTYSDDDWKKRLSPAAYDVMRHEGTERPYSSPLNNEHRAGLFACAGCNLDAFDSKTKFDSGTGWPSFYQPLQNSVGETRDSTLGMVRTEVHCRRCGSHFGHVFDDGPKPTGLRYCMNGLSLKFTAAAV